MNLPKKLYKYESFSVQSLSNLKNQTVFFGSPAGFNDPFDCAIRADLQQPKDNELEFFREFFISKKGPAPLIEKLKKMPLQPLIEMVMESAKNINEERLSKFIDTRGVSCFSEVNDDLLMWAHYGDKYTGFCLEFETDNDLFEKAKKVEYVGLMPKLDVKKVFLDKERPELLKLYCTKSSSWSYEREWRVIHSVANTVFTYPAEILTGVYFGPNMPTEIIEIICLVLRGQNNTVNFWRGIRSQTNFTVKFEEFIYTPHLKPNA